MLWLRFLQGRRSRRMAAAGNGTHNRTDRDGAEGGGRERRWRLRVPGGGVLVGVLGLYATRVSATPAPHHLPAPSRDSTSAATAEPRVTGIVRNTDTDEPVRNTLVQVIGMAGSARTDSIGRYALQLTPGSHTLRFTHPGYRPLTLVVLVGERQVSAVDVGLEPMPAVLPAVRVHSDRNAIDRDRAGANPDPRRTPDGGTQWSHAAMEASPRLAQSDVLHLVETAPTAATQSEAPFGLHVDGGMADQNLILLDGIPIENAVHTGALTSAINPDAIETTTLYADRTPARFGGRLGGVVDLKPRGVSSRESNGRPADPLQVEGRVEYGGAALLAEGEHQATGAFGLVSMRHSLWKVRRFWTQPDLGDLTSKPLWSDVLARAGVRVAGGELVGLGFRSQDAAHFYGYEPRADANTFFMWQSSASGAGWTGMIDRTHRDTLALRTWQSIAWTREVWGSPRDTIRATKGMGNWFMHRGASADMHITRDDLDMHVGGSTERLHTLYETSDTITTIAFIGDVFQTSLYTDARWRIGNRWIAFPGLRMTHDRRRDKAAIRFEPRLGAAVTATRQVRAAVFYSVTTQPLQSLRNEESAYEGIAGLDLLAVQNDSVPAAVSRLLSGTITAAVTPTLTVVLGGYDRRSSHLLIIPLSTEGVFALDSLHTGAGRSAGWYAEAAHETSRLFVDAVYRNMSTQLWRTAPTITYVPSFSAKQAASFAVRYRVGRYANVQSSLVAMAGRPTALTRGTLDWDWRDYVDGDREARGTAAATAPGSYALPPYVSMSVGASHDVYDRALDHQCDTSGDDRATGPATSCRIPSARVFATVDNVFNRKNAGALVAPVDGAPGDARQLALRPRTLVFGLQLLL